MSSSWNQSDLDSILESLRNQRRRTTSGSFSENERHLYARDEIMRLMNHCEALKQAVEVKKVSKSADDRLLLTAVQTACDAAALALIVNGIQHDFESGILLQLFREKFEKDTTQPLSPLDACVLSLVSCLDSPLFCQMKEAEVERVVKSASARLVVIASLRYFERQSAHKKEGEENLRYYAVHLKVRHFNDEVERVRSLADVLQRFINLNNRVPFFSDQGSEGFNIDQEAGDSQVSSEVLDVTRDGKMGPSAFLPIAILAKGISTIAERFRDITTSLLLVAPDHEISFAEYEEEVAEKQTAKDQAAGKKASESDKLKQTKGGVKEGSKEKGQTIEDEEKARKVRIDKARQKRDSDLISLFEDHHSLFLALIEVVSSVLPQLDPVKIKMTSLVVPISISESCFSASMAHGFVIDGQQKNMEEDKSFAGFIKLKRMIIFQTMELFGLVSSLCTPHHTTSHYHLLSTKKLLLLSSKDSSSEGSALMDKIPQHLHSGCIMSSRGLVERAADLIKKADRAPHQLLKDADELIEEAKNFRIPSIVSLLSNLIKVTADKMHIIESIPWNTIQTLLNSAEVLFSMVTQIVKSVRQDEISPEFSHSLLVIHRNVVTSILRPLTLTVSNALQLCKDATTSPDDQIKILKISESILDCIDLALMTSIDSLLAPGQDKAAKRGHISFEARLLVSCQLDYLLSELISSSLSLTDDSEAHDGVYKVVTKASSLSLRISGLIMTQPPSSLSPSPSDVDIDCHLVNGWWSYHLCQSQLIPAMAQAVISLTAADKGRTLRPSLQALLVSLYIQILPLATMLIQIETRMKLAPLLLPNEVLSFASAVEKLSNAAKAAIPPCSKDSNKTDFDLMNALRSVSCHIASLFSVGGGPLSIEWSALKDNNPAQPLWPSFLDRAWGQKAMFSSSSSSSDHLTHHFFKIKDPLIEQAIKQCKERASKPALCASIPAFDHLHNLICAAGKDNCGSLSSMTDDDDFSLCSGCGLQACKSCTGWCEHDNHNCTMLEQLREMSIGSMDESLEEILRQIEGTDNDYFTDQAFALKLKRLDAKMNLDGLFVDIVSREDVQELRAMRRKERAVEMLEVLRGDADEEGSKRAVLELARLSRSKGMEDMKTSLQEERREELERCKAKGEKPQLLRLREAGMDDFFLVTEEEVDLLKTLRIDSGVVRLIGAEDDLFKLFLQHARMDPEFAAKALEARRSQEIKDEEETTSEQLRLMETQRQTPGLRGARLQGPVSTKRPSSDNEESIHQMARRMGFTVFTFGSSVSDRENSRLGASSLGSEIAEASREGEVLSEELEESPLATVDKYIKEMGVAGGGGLHLKDNDGQEDEPGCEPSSSISNHGHVGLDDLD